MSLGKLIGVSLGPGDADLITRRAWAQLQRSEALWTYPVRSLKTESYALAIAQRSGVAVPEDAQHLLFPMTHDVEKLSRAWLRAATQVLPVLQSGRDVLFLVEGDASTYATFGHLERTVRGLDAAVQVEIIPGITSFHASCARLQIPFSEQDDTVAIVPAAYGVEMVERMLDDFDTLVLMKVKPLIDELIDLLERRDLLDKSCFVEKAGAPEERVLRGPELLSLRGTKVNYLSLLLVKNDQRLRGERVKGCKKKVSP
ncbi:precorrin-2/cobalt-factor-2 C20-methyltransferase [Paucibacter oligotrophus]|uniref:Precorrin-2 C(20)-methyltransferase n=1 Tax=Roseateles oligotrophus TaxID=1769250 RepID=A0A840L6L6_9BURK|nr:precorrin-2 C(20)-methyltransferase [Roseateles oligotrophus]MBB4843810.1 precorrin-2/cobalt-factor-2 C20-methyltransferase [Roseateles oligotrophus]